MLLCYMLQMRRKSQGGSLFTVTCSDPPPRTRCSSGTYSTYTAFHAVPFSAFIQLSYLSFFLFIPDLLSFYSSSYFLFILPPSLPFPSPLHPHFFLFSTSPFIDLTVSAFDLRSYQSSILFFIRFSFAHSIILYSLLL